MFILLSLPVYFMIYGIDGSDRGRLREVFTFFAGFLSVLNIRDALVHVGQYDYYILFLLPLVRILILILLTMTIYESLGEYGYMKYLLIGAGLVGSVLFNFTTFFFYTNLFIPANLILGFFCLFGGIMSFMSFRNR